MLHYIISRAFSTNKTNADFLLKIPIGAVVASRLSEMENWNVLLLEAGGDETEISDVPLMAAYLQLSGMDWKYKSEPQGNACLGQFLSTNTCPCRTAFALLLQQ